MNRPFKSTAASQPHELPPSGITGAERGAVPATFAGDPENFIELGYGTGPRCIQCRRNVSMCLCNAPEPEPEYFRPGGNFDPDSGWALAERSAFQMGGK